MGNRDSWLILLRCECLSMDPDTDFERLVDLYYPSPYRFAFTLTRQESDASDLTQETFHIWVRKGRQLRYLREFTQQRRRSARHSGVALSEVEHELPEVAPAGHSNLDRSTVLERLKRLDPVFQAPVALLSGRLSYPEMAQILEIPLGTVKSRILRSIAQLQEALVGAEPSIARKEVRE